MHKLGGWDGQYLSYLVQRMLLDFGFVGKRHNDRGDPRFSKRFTGSNSWIHPRTIDACLFWEPDFNV